MFRFRGGNPTRLSPARSWRLLRGTALAGSVAAATVLGAAAAGHATAPTAPAPAAGVHHVLSHGHVYTVETHGRHGVIPMRTGAAATHQARPAAASDLQYGGGPVEHHVKVYLVFWGSQWNSDSNGVEQYQQGLFQGLGTSQDSWSTVTSQYTDSSGQGPTFNGAVLGGTWVDNASPAPSSSSQADIAAEADAGAQHFGVSGTDTQIVVMSPSGTSPDGFPDSGFCAWHDWNGNVSYTNMPYVLDAGSSCGADSVQNQLDGFSIVGGHEYAESLTDPQPASGWVASDGEENGDLCAWQGLGAIGLPTGSFAMQPTWSNNAGGCAMSG